MKPKKKPHHASVVVANETSCCNIKQGWECEQTPSEPGTGFNALLHVLTIHMIKIFQRSILPMQSILNKMKFQGFYFESN